MIDDEKLQEGLMVEMVSSPPVVGDVVRMGERIFECTDVNWDRGDKEIYVTYRERGWDPDTRKYFSEADREEIVKEAARRQGFSSGGVISSFVEEQPGGRVVPNWKNRDA